MRGFMGCDRRDLQPGDKVRAANGMRIVIIREVTLEEARESWEQCADGSALEPVGDERWYEVEATLVAEVMN